MASEDLAGRIDEVRGLVPRETWMRVMLQRAVERALSETKEPLSREQADPGLRTPGEGRSAAPAEQAVGGQQKRGNAREAEERDVVNREPSKPAERPVRELSRTELFRRATQKR